METHDVRNIILNWCLDVSKDSLSKHSSVKYDTLKENADLFNAVNAAKKYLNNPTRENKDSFVSMYSNASAARSVFYDSSRSVDFAISAVYYSIMGYYHSAVIACFRAIFFAVKDSADKNELENSLRINLQNVFENSLQF